MLDLKDDICAVWMLILLYFTSFCHDNIVHYKIFNGTDSEQVMEKQIYHAVAAL